MGIKELAGTMAKNFFLNLFQTWRTIFQIAHNIGCWHTIEDFRELTFRRLVFKETSWVVSSPFLLYLQILNYGVRRREGAPDHKDMTSITPSLYKISNIMGKFFY